MYEKILVTLDGTPSDRAIIEHVKQLAKLAQSRLVLLHVADGWAARTYGPDAVSPEIAEDTGLPGQSAAEFRRGGHSGGGRTGLWRPGQGDHQMDRGRRVATWWP